MYCAHLLHLYFLLRNSLWATSGGVPSDFRALHDIKEGSIITDDSIPPSFRGIMNEIGTCENESIGVVDPSQMVLCTLTERLLMNRPSILLPYFISHIQFNASEVTVILSILEKRSIIPNQIPDRLMLDIEERMLDLLESNTHFQRMIYSKKGIFVATPVKSLVKRLLIILEKSEVSSLASSAVSRVLSDVIQRNSMQNGESIVTEIIAFLNHGDSGTKNDTTKSRRSSNCLKYASKWRNALLADLSCEDEAFSSIVTACGRAMVKNPSNPLILSLFGALIGDGIHQSKDSSDIRMKRIQYATKTLVLLSISELERLDNKVDRNNIFERLCPLLMLRRIPPHYFRLAHIGISIIEDNYLQQLSDIIVRKLQLGTSTLSNHADSVSADERRLFADIAAKCLPFSRIKSSPLKTGFETFCKAIISSSQLKSKTLSKVNWKALKICVYIGCQVVQISPVMIGREEYSCLINFTMSLLSVDSCEDKETVQSMIEAQAGCIEFLATCMCAIHKFSYEIRVADTPTLIAEIEPHVYDDDAIVTTAPYNDHHPGAKESFEFLCHLRSNILNLIHCKKVAGFPPPSEISLHRDQEHWIYTEWTLSSRICLLNVLSISLQRCTIEVLPKLADVIVPALQGWLLDGSIGDKIRHPLCIAAAMQCIFNALQRSKSFACLYQANCIKNSETPGMAEQHVRHLFEVASHVIEHQLQTSPSNNDAYDQASMRVAALKLLVVIVSIDADSDKSSCTETCTGTVNTNRVCGFIPPSDLVRVLTIIRGLANMDESSDVRKLAAHFLSFMEKRFQ